MKLLALILLSACLAASANGHTQVITYSGSNVKVETVFSVIKQQSGYSFFYNNADLHAATLVTVNLKNATLENALQLVLANQPLQFSIEGKTIFISKKNTPDPVAVNEKAAIPFIDISGRVTDKEGNPLQGASVTIKGMNRGTTTNSKGEFLLTNAKAEDEIVISFTEYVSQTIRVGNHSAFMFALEHSDNALDQVQVIAYGQQTRRKSVGNVSTVTSKEIGTQLITNPLVALEGRVPGLLITQTNGLPGSAVSVKIQGGANTFNAGGSPLYVIDGVPYPANQLPNLAQVLGAPYDVGSYNYSSVGAGNPMSYINPGDIESISVLKDADATSIYGSKAANGAILITTKKGKAGQTKVNLDLQQGFGKNASTIKLLTSQQYLQMRHEYLQNSGLVPGPSDYDLNGTYDSTRYTDWQKFLVGNTAHYANFSSSISGGTNNFRFLTSATYHKETTIYPGSFSDQKASAFISLDNVSNNQRFRINLTTSYSFDDNKLPKQDVSTYALGLSPVDPPLFDTNGGINWAPSPTRSDTWVNPLARYFYTTYRGKTNNLVSSLGLSYQVLPGLDIKTSIGYNSQWQKENTQDPITIWPPTLQAIFSRTASFSFNNINSWIVEPQLSYKRSIGRGALSTMIGTTFQQQNSSGLIVNGSGFGNDLLLGSIAAAPNLTSSNTAIKYNYTAVFGRINYIQDQKYILNLNARRDGSSRFGPNNRFANFYSVGAGWIFSEENFVKENLKWLSSGKINASYGTTGNDQIGDYTYMNLYNVINNVSAPYRGIPGLEPSGITNPDLQWEFTKKLNIGIDLGFLKDRVLVNANFYNNRSSNQLLGYALPIQTGFDQVTKNFPAVIQSNGIELAISSVNIRTNDFEWTSNLVLTRPMAQAKLLAFENLETSSYSQTYKIGRSIRTGGIYHFMGVNPTTGIYQFSDGKGGTTSHPEQLDYTTVTTPFTLNPQFYGGITNTLRYKSFDMAFSFQFVKQNTANFYFGSGDPYTPSLGNMPAYTLNHWRKPGDNAPYQKWILNDPDADIAQFYAAYYSDAAYTNLLFIRLQNLSLTWSMSEKLYKKINFKGLQLYVHAQNLFTITPSFKGVNSEVGGTAMMPLRMLSFGINATL